MRSLKLQLASWICFSFSTCLLADDALVRKVQELELSGENSSRQAALAELDDSLSKSAHWLRGEIQVGEEWVPYRRVVDHGDRWAELHRYREQRAKRGNGIDDQFYLADGARHHKLFDEERAHLHGVLFNDSDNEEARKRLGDRMIEGQWVTSEEALLAERSVRMNQRSFEQWGKIVERQARLLSDRSAKRREAGRAALHEITDPMAIPVMEQFLGRGNEPQQLEYLTWVCRLNSWMASAAIARLATASDSAVVRVKATNELKSRRLEDYAPTILGSMMTPIAIHTATQTNGNWVFYSQHAVTETQSRGFDYHYLARFSPQFLTLDLRVNRMGAITPATRFRVSEDPAISSARDGERTFAILSEHAQERADEQNHPIQSWNERCNRVLSEVTGTREMSSPLDWWAWWEDDQGYVFDSKLQVFRQYEEEWYVGRRRGPVPRRGTSPFMPVAGMTIAVGSSCFAAGTPVVTEFGPKPIESIVRADRVLSQDIETGELSFKPVLQTTFNRSPGSAIVKLGDEQLTCTPGHPFWVNGKGWRMARELEPGDRFHSVSGSVDVTGVDTGEKADVYNLVVGDFHTYFVGKNPILTHDVTVRQPTDMALPGFSKENAAVASQK